MNRDEQRECWRLASLEAIEAEDVAARRKEGKQIFMDELVETLIEHAEQEGNKLSQAKAERLARTSAAFKSYLSKMHDARKKACLLRLAAEDQDRRYWAGVSAEATFRAEARMTQ